MRGEYSSEIEKGIPNDKKTRKTEAEKTTGNVRKIFEGKIVTRSRD